MRVNREEDRLGTKRLEDGIRERERAKDEKERECGNR